MKKLFFIFLILLAPALHAKCDKKIDPKKVMIFIDTNISTPEIEKAQAGACERGQRLVIIPKNHKEYDVLFEAQKELIRQMDKCDGVEALSKHCRDVKEKANAIDEKINTLRQNGVNYRNLLTEELEELKKSNSSVVSFIISGHDGGGYFGGLKGSFGRSSIESVFKMFPEVNKVESALLLGCYTGVKFEVKQWVSVFPDLRLLGGYDSSAPLSERREGQDYVKELLMNEKKLLEKTDQKKLEKKLFSNIKSISNLNAGVYIKPKCVTGKDAPEGFYFGSQTRDKGLEGLVVGECEKPEVAKEISEMEPRFKMYISSELEPPSDTVNGELRQMYNRARKLEHCLAEKHSLITISPIFNLLFFNGIKESFAAFYKDDLKKAEDILKDVNLDEVVKNQEKMLEDMEKYSAFLKKQNELLAKSPEKYIEEAKKKYEEGSKKYDQLLADPAYKSLLEKMPSLKEKVYKGFSFFNYFNSLTKEEQAKANELSSLKTKLTTMDYNIKQAAIDPELLTRNNLDRLRNAEGVMNNISANIAKFKGNTSLLKNVWVPTEENLKNKTRKEILENIHKMYELSSLPWLPPKATAALSWVGGITNQHLSIMQNPFSWHERAKKVEAPPYTSSLKNVLDYYDENNNSASGNGYPAGMNMGMMMDIGGGDYTSY